jgi:hypothetical protein
MQLDCSGLPLQSALLFDVVSTAAGADDAYIGAVSQALPTRYACWWHCGSSNQEWELESNVRPLKRFTSPQKHSLLLTLWK